MSSETLGTLKGEFDWESYEKIATDFVKSAKRMGKAVATKILEHQKKIMEIAQKVNEKRLDSIAGKRALSRHKRSISVYLKSLEKQINWERANAYWKASGDLLSWIGLLLSTVIKAI